MRNWLLLLVVLLCTALAVFDATTAAQSAPSVVLEEIGRGFGAVTDVQHAPGANDGSNNRLFVVDRGGRIRLFDVATATATGTFLDLTDRVAAGGERGLLGLAFHPDYARNGHLFVHYSADGGAARNDDGSDGACGTSRIARFTRAITDSSNSAADPGSELVVAEIGQPFCNHNGGQLRFSPADGYLYIALGDGGSGNDPQNSASNPQSLLGKLLRVDANDLDGSEARPLPRWRIPPDNPFANGGPDGARPEIWHLGLRNPWRFCFDTAADGSGSLFVADVGQGDREEINRVDGTARGLHFGWRACEGRRVNFGTELPAGCSCEEATTTATGSGDCFVAPVLEYEHRSGRGGSVTGGCVYRGAEHPSLAGTYFYADFSFGTLWGAQQGGNGAADGDEWRVVFQLENAVVTPTTFGVDASGEMYVGTLGGILYRLRSTANEPDRGGGGGLLGWLASFVSGVVNFVLGFFVGILEFLGL